MKTSGAHIKSTTFSDDFNREAETLSKSKLNSRFDGCAEDLIWKAYKKGSREAFVYIYYKYFPVLYSYGHQLSGNSEFIKDCIQELFVDLSKKGRKLSDTTSIKFYLIKSLKNKLIRALKKDVRVKENEKFFPGYEFQFTLSTEQKIINAQLDEERIEKLNKALALLTGRQREAIYYYFYENLSIDEIAAMMNVANRRTIQNLIYRAISYLRNNIDLGTLLLFLPYLSLKVNNII